MTDPDPTADSRLAPATPPSPSPLAPAPPVDSTPPPASSHPGPSPHAGSPPLRSGLRAVLAAALLSATLASVSTAALVTTLAPAGSSVDTSATVSIAEAQAASLTLVETSDEALVAVITKARQSVVTITSQIETTRRGPFGGTTTGVGSGVIVTSDGYILTNAHVVEGATALTVELPDGTQYAGTVVATSTSDDLALVRIEASGLPAATLAAAGSAEVGETAIAIGSPLGEYTDTVTKGIVSAIGRDIEVQDSLTGQVVELTDLIQTDAAINQGNSGGPLLDADGAVIGINTAMATSAEGLGFATPIEAAAELLEGVGLATS
jgi:S1-C subfamily serine protease